MESQLKLAKGAIMFGEIQEFGSFSITAQRYICRSLDVANCAHPSPEEWAHSAYEACEIRAQIQVYGLIPGIRDSMPHQLAHIDAEGFLLPLIAVSGFDLSCRCLDSFGAFRFLYERLFGAMVRPWLSSAFAAASALPYFSAYQRSALLASVGAELTDQWSPVEPIFYPQSVGFLEFVAA